MKLPNTVLIEIYQRNANNQSIEKIADTMALTKRTVKEFLNNKKRCDKIVELIAEQQDQQHEEADKQSEEVDPDASTTAETDDEQDNEEEQQEEEKDNDTNHSENQSSRDDFTSVINTSTISFVKEDSNKDKKEQKEDNDEITPILSKLNNDAQNEMNNILNLEPEPEKQEEEKQEEKQDVTPEFKYQVEIVSPVFSEKKEIFLEEEPVKKQPTKNKGKKKQDEDNQKYTDIINIPCDNIDDLKAKRSKIIVIRQYIQTFEDQLQGVIGKNKTQFINKLVTLSTSQLECIHENILFELNLSSNASKFNNGIEFIMRSLEKVSTNVFGYDVDGAWDELSKDQEFIMDLRMIQCELDISRYISPKASLFLKIIKKYYMRYNHNKITKKLDNLDDVKLQKINEKYKDL